MMNVLHFFVYLLCYLFFSASSSHPCISGWLCIAFFNISTFSFNPLASSEYCWRSCGWMWWVVCVIWMPKNYFKLHSSHWSEPLFVRLSLPAIQILPWKSFFWRMWRKMIWWYDMIYEIDMMIWDDMIWWNTQSFHARCLLCCTVWWRGLRCVSRAVQEAQQIQPARRKQSHY